MSQGEVFTNEDKTPTTVSSCWPANHKRKQYSINLNDYRQIRIFWRHKQSFGDVYGYITKHLKVGGVVPDIQTSEQIRAVEYQCARDDRVSAYALRVLVKNLGTRPK